MFGKDFDISSLWISLAAKIAISVKDGLGDRHVHRCEEAYKAKFLWYVISILMFFLNDFALPQS